MRDPRHLIHRNTTRWTLVGIGLSSALVALTLANCGGDDPGTMTPVGCTDDTQCTSPFTPWCQVASGQCVACPTGQSCPKGQTCQKAGATYDCIEACVGSADCLGAKSTCCSHVCVSLLSTSNCGACGNACAGNMDCISNTCKCPSGSPELCGSKCTDPKKDVANCGSCGHDCGTVKNGYPGCTDGKCLVAGCNKGFGNCDNDDSNGCETSTNTTLAHCGGCGMECLTRPNADPTCLNGKCSMVCKGDWRSCDMMDDNGCEANLMTDHDNCGGCGQGFGCKVGQSCVDGKCTG